MKLLPLLFLLVILSSCSQGPKHPQADLVNQRINPAMTEASIIIYADSIDATLNTYEKNTSLVYQLGSANMYVEKYSLNGKPVLFAQYTNDEGISNDVKKYYFKSDSLILLKEGGKLTKQGSDLFQESRTYLRNNIPFKEEYRNSATISSLKTKPLVVKKSTTSDQTKEYSAEIVQLNDAVLGVNKFDLVFDNIISSPEERYILLKSKIANGYNASIFVRETDSRIDSILNDPSIFKDKKLDIKWEVKNKEAVYVPVAARVTSANGLKR